jgi:hypothetical protein
MLFLEEVSMELSIFLAKVLGLWIFVGSLAALIRPKLVEGIAKEMSRSEAFLYLTGFVALLIGILLIVLHNIWVGWPIVITILGWLFVLRGLVRIFLPEKANKLLRWFLDHKNYLVFSCVVGLLVGLYLLYFGFLS